MTIQFFSESYYLDRSLFLDKVLPRVTIKANSEYVGEYAYVDQNGTINSRPLKESLFGRFLSFVGCRQNPDLGAVDTKLCALYDALKEANNADSQKFKDEVRKEGPRRFVSLAGCIRNLHTIMQRNNQKSTLQKAAITLVNLVRRLFGKSEIAFRHYSFGDRSKEEVQQLLKSVKKECFKMSDAEKKAAQSTLEIRNGSGLQERPPLTAKRIYKLQANLTEKPLLPFCLQNHRFWLSYEPVKAQFFVQYYGEDFDSQAKQQAETKSYDLQYSVDLIVENEPSPTIFHATSRRTQTVGHGLFTSGLKSYSHIPSPIYELPFDKEIQIRFDNTNEPFRFVIRKAAPSAAVNSTVS